MMRDQAVPVHGEGGAFCGRDDRVSLWPRRLAAMSLSSAGGIHLVLTPEHFEEQVVYGIFFLVAGIFQIVLAPLLVLRPGPLVFRAGAYGNASLIAIWIVTRVIAPPLGESPEPVTLWGVLAKGLELTALVLLLTLLPPSTPRDSAGRSGVVRPRFAWGWALGTGAGFTLLFLFASGSLTYVPGAMPPLPGTIDPWQGPSLIRPWVEGPLTPHLYLRWRVVARATSRAAPGTG